jgi:hypothetical protein
MKNGSPSVAVPGSLVGSFTLRDIAMCSVPVGLLFASILSLM